MANFATAAALLSILCLPVPADAREDGEGVVETTWQLRLRHEHVDDAFFARRADARTLRARFGVRIAPAEGWTAMLEGEAVANAGGDHDSGANGRVDYPAVVDPAGAELNQAWVGWRNDRVGATVGRQRVAFDNQRWVGNVGWRQNEQTFDAVAFDVLGGEGWMFGYRWLGRVHRVAGDRALAPLAAERRLDSHLFHVAHARGKQQWTGYAYLHRDLDVPLASSDTHGLRWTGEEVRGDVGVAWAIEAARQHGYDGASRRVAHDYWLLEPSMTWKGTRFTVGWEHLGGNGRHALQTPLATLHAFNGWADRFLVTPPGGLEDRYIAVSGTLLPGKRGGVAWVVACHDFRADRRVRGGARLGRECDASLGMALGEGFQGLAKLATYDGQADAGDVRKLWLQLEWTGAR